MLVIGSLAAIPAKAQVSLNINIGSQPQWGPTGYNHVDYYYLPEVQSYYYVPTRKFIYYSGNNWVHSSYLPGRYRNYDLYRGRKVVINSSRPYLRHNDYRNRYVSNYYRPRSNNYGRGNSFRNRNRYENNYGRGNSFGNRNRYENRNYRRESSNRHENQDRGHSNGPGNHNGNNHGNGHGNGRGRH
jgi:hypothetical protein